MAKKLIVAASIMGFLAVALGAFGAHGLKSVLLPADMQIFQTGVQYQMVHALALMAAGILCKIMPECKQFQWAGIAFTLGMFFFSVSLYLLALSGVKMLGAGVPIGGVLLLIGWINLAIGAYKNA